MIKDLLLILGFCLGLSTAHILPSNICQNQLNDRRLPHPNECHKFIVCHNQEVQNIGNCPLGLHFNPMLGICDLIEKANCITELPRSRQIEKKAFAHHKGPSTGPSGTTCVNSGKCSGQPDGTMFADRNSYGYIVCQCECEIQMPCAPGTKFDEKQRTCDHFYNNSDSSDSCNNPGRCADQPNGTVFPNPITNTGFIQCQNYCEVAKTCKTGLIFNATTLTCVNTCNGGGNGVTCGGTNGITCLSSGQCAGEKNGKIFPASNNTSFKVCLNECEIVRSCVPGTVFNENLERCVYVNGGNLDDNHKCEDVKEKCSSFGQCLGEPDGAKFSYPNSKTKYIECFCQCEMEKSCNAGFIFDDSQQRCINPDSGSGEHNEIDCSGIKCSTSGKCKQQPDGVIFANPHNNEGYIECKCQCEQEKLCAPGLIFSPNQQHCIHKTVDHCDDIKCKNPGKCSQQPDGAIFANPKSDYGFIECKCQCEQEKLCAPGLVFSPAYKNCVHEETENPPKTGCSDINCSTSGKCSQQPDGAIFANPKSDYGFIECKCQCEQEKLCAPGLVFSPAYKNCVHEETENPPKTDCSDINCSTSGKCSQQPDGAIFANPKSDYGFIECKCQCEQEKLCAPGLVFSPAYKNCVHEETENPPKTDCSDINCSTSGKCSQKPDGAIFANPKSDYEFIECKCQCEQEKLCAPGLVFSPAHKNCVHEETENPPKTDCSDINCSTSGKCKQQQDGAIFANPKSDYGFIECKCQCEQEKLCAPGLVFSPSYKNCVHVKTEETENPHKTDCSDINCSTSGKCKQQPDGAIFANPKSDYGFIECKCQCEQEKLCAAGLVFSPAYKNCVHVKTEETENPSKTDCSDINCSTSGKCSQQPDGAIFANPKSDYGFIECKCQCEQEKLCAPGLVFSPSYKNCVHVKTEETENPHKTDCSDINCSTSGKCKQQPDGAIFANPKSDYGFIECKCQCEQEKLCAAGLVFSPSYKNCVHVKTEETENPLKTDCSDINCSTSGKCSQQPDGAIFANPKSDYGFIECKCQCEQEKLCAPGLVFSPAYKNCVHVKTEETENPSKTDCSDINCSNSGKCKQQPDGAIFANPKSDYGFIECKCQCEHEKLCAPGLVFSPAYKNCVHVKTEETENPIKTDCSGTHCSTSNNGCGLCSEPGICLNQPEGTIVANSNLNGFTVCSYGCPIEWMCESGTKFNEVLNTCTDIDMA